MVGDLSIIGDKTLQRALNNLAGPEVIKAMKAGVRAGGKITLKSTRNLAPKDSGDLKKGIVLRVGKKQRKGSAAMVVMINATMTDLFKAASGTAAKDSKRVRSGKGKWGESYYYPAAQEFGWTRGGTYHPGKPYMRAGFDQTQNHTGPVIEQMIWKRMLELWKAKA